MPKNDNGLRDLISQMHPRIDISDSDMNKIIKDAQDFKKNLESDDVKFNFDNAKCGRKQAIAYQVGHFIVKQKLNLKKI